MRMQLIVSNIHQKSMEIHLRILIAVVLANGGLLLTTGQYLFIFYTIVKQDTFIMGDLFCEIGWE